jgi:hypothetical protein
VQAISVAPANLHSADQAAVGEGAKADVSTELRPAQRLALSPRLREDKYTKQAQVVMPDGQDFEKTSSALGLPGPMTAVAGAKSA